MHWVLRSEDSAFLEYEVDDLLRYSATDVTAHRYHIGHFLKRCDQWMDLYWPTYIYSPDFQLFFDVFPNQILGSLRQTGAFLTEMVLARDAPLFNALVSALRQQAKICRTRYRMAERLANLGYQGESIAALLRRTQACGRPVRLLRIDLQYMESVVLEEEAMPRRRWGAVSRAEQSDIYLSRSDEIATLETRSRIDPISAMGDRERFFSNRFGRDFELFEGMLAYICKMETGGQHRANHFHCLLIFDGTLINWTKLNRKVAVASNRWSHATGGNGLVFDSRNRGDIDDLKARGLWALDVEDLSNSNQYDFLERYAVGYFTKYDDQMLRVKPAPRARTLTMGCVI